VFSFFRKKGPDGQEVITQAGPSTQAGSTTPAPNRDEPLAASKPAVEAAYDLSKLSIEVASSSDTLSPAEEQAAMLYASGQSNAATKVLLNDKPHFVGKHRLDSWLMLFELLQQQNMRDAFDALALDYVLEFEKTPPVWHNQQPAGTSKATASGYHAFGNKLSLDNIDQEIQAFRKAQQNHDQLRLDLSKVIQIDTMAAAELLAAFQQRHKTPSSLQILGSQDLVEQLRARIEVGRRNPAEAPFWLLLIELQQILGLQEEFENLAVDYAITFEVSPPSWDPRQVPKSAAQIAAAEALAKAEISAAENEKNMLSGHITAQTPAVLAKLCELVEHSLSPTIDLQHIARIDFDSAGQLLNLAMAWLQQGRQVRFINTNPLVHTLLRVMSIHEMITIELRK
jgi:anti-anti-sigma regulatory factor